MSKQIIKDQKIIEDHWQRIADEAALPATGDIIVTHKRWQQERATLLSRKGGLGVIIGNGVAVEEIIDDLPHFKLIAIEFPQFKDGRGYSYARLLRDRYRYPHEIRALGNVLRDQILPMARCGINAFELEPGRNLEDALKSFNDFSVRYQPAADGEETPFSWAS
jgi:uncharacterized protein (DUF934 family)